MLLEAISARDIAVSGLRAQRLRMNIIANNVANAETTRTPEGGAFRRQMTILEGGRIGPGGQLSQLGVRVKRVEGDPSPLKVIFEPNHPDANQDGYVSYPNVNMAVEMVNLLSAQRAYEANVAVLVSGNRMRQSALELLRR